MAGLGSLVVSLEANIAKFESGMNRAAYVTNQNMRQIQSSVDSLKTTFQGIAVAVTGAFAIESIHGFLDAITEVGAKTEKLQTSMQAMGKLYGISQESLVLVSEQIQRVGITASEAAGGINSFIKYGLEITKLPRLAQMAADLAAIDNEGRNAREMFNLLVNAIGRGPRALMQLRLGSGEAFKAMAKEIKEAENEAFLSMPERAGVAFKLLENATRNFAGVSSSVMDSYAKKQQTLIVLTEEFKVALFEVAKPIFTAVLGQQIKVIEDLTASLANSRGRFEEVGTAIGVFAAKVTGTVGKVTSFVAANKELIAVALELYGIGRLIGIISGIAAAMTAAMMAMGTYIAGLTTLKGLVAGPWPPIIISVTVLGLAVALRGLRDLVAAKLEAMGVLATNYAKPVTAGPRDQILSAEGTKISAEQRAALISEVDAREENNKEAAKQKAIMESINAAAKRAEEVKTTMPGGGGKKGGGGGADAAASRLENYISTMREQTARASGDSLAALDAWYAKQVEALNRIEAKTSESFAAREALQAAYNSKREKLENDYNLFVAKESGNAYVEIEAQAKDWLGKYQGFANAEENIAIIKNRKIWSQQAKDYEEQQNLIKGYFDSIAQVTSELSRQVEYQQKSLAIENELALVKIDQLMNENKISQAMADEMRGMQALVNQAKAYNIEREGWKTGGIGGGLEIGAYELSQTARTWQAEQTSSWIKGAPQQISTYLAQNFIDGIKTGKVDLEATFIDLGYTTAQTILQKFYEGWLNQLIPMIASSLGGIFRNITGGGGGGGGFLSNMFSGLFGGSGGAGNLSFDTGMYSPFHYGGIVRAHGGLAADEVPAILQTGERVLSRSQNAAYERGTQVNVTVINNSKAQVEPQVSNQGNEIQIMLEDAIDRSIRGGKGYRAIRQTFNLNPSTVGRQ